MKKLFSPNPLPDRAEYCADIYGVSHEFYEGEYHLEVWDSIGSIITGTINPGFWSDSRLALIVIDVTNRESLENAEYYHRILMFEEGQLLFLSPTK